MIRLIGIKKIILIILFCGLSGMFAFYYYMIVTKEIAANRIELTNSTNEISELTEDLNKLKLGIGQFQEQKEKYEQIKRHDFFNAQDRVEARKKLNAIKKVSGVIAAPYTIKSAQDEENEDLQKAGYKILNTPLEFSIEAINDNDIYKYIYLLNYGFPGEITIEEIIVSRDREITFALLKQIGVGEEEVRPLLSANIKASWRTIVPDPEFEVSEE